MEYMEYEYMEFYMELYSPYKYHIALKNKYIYEWLIYFRLDGLKQKLTAMQLYITNIIYIILYIYEYSNI